LFQVSNRDESFVKAKETEKAEYEPWGDRPVSLSFPSISVAQSSLSSICAAKYSKQFSKSFRRALKHAISPLNHNYLAH
jgi:hypothetical protein